MCALILLSACSSNLKKGNNMMEAEQYVQAVAYYEKAMLDDPGEEEVATKLYEARSSMVSAKLIKVRLLRQSNQQRGAAILLNESLQNIQDWKIIADSGVKATIADEVLDAGNWLNRELSSLGEGGQYNRFFFSLKQFHHITRSGLADRSINSYKPVMLKSGQNQCGEMKKRLTSQSYFLHDVWKAYCAQFSIQARYKLAKDGTRYLPPKISSARIKVSRAAGFKADYIPQTISRSIHSHPWFSEFAGKPLTLTLEGNINYGITSKNKIFKHIYKVKNETFEIVKDKKNPKKDLRKLVHTETKKKEVSFKGIQYTEKTSHKLALKGGINGQSISAAEASATQIKKSNGHTTYFKSEGIKPLSAKLINKNQWKRSMGGKIASQVKQRLDEIWISSFCEARTPNKNLARNEHAARCAVLNDKHATVIAWAKSEFALDYDELKVLIK
jgi:hypothetical protein